MASVPGEKFGLEYFVQPGGRGSVTVRSVSLSSATCAPVTPTPERYCAIGVGVADVDAVVDVGLDGSSVV